MRSLLPLVLLFVTGASNGQAPAPAPRATASPAAGTIRLAPDAEARWVPFTLTPGNQIRFPLTLDGRSLDAILDTGVSVTILSDQSRAVDPARLTAGGEATAVGGAVALRWMPIRTLAIGALTREGGAVAVTTLPAIATGSGGGVDMLVGRDLLEGHALDIDYAARRFRLIPSGRLPFAGQSAPLSVSRERQVYESVISVGRQAIRPVIVDTGDGAAVTLTQAAWDAAGLGRLRWTTSIGFGLAGSQVTRLAIAPEVTLGEAQARQIEVRTEGAGGFSQAIGAAGRIGSGLLGRYRVLLDPGAGRMVLSPRLGADAAPLRSTSGLLVGIEPSRLKVLHVMANGPAATAGWRAGDLICAINGQAIPADYATSPLARWSVGAPGTAVRLRGCDGMERTLTLARFY